MTNIGSTIPAAAGMRPAQIEPVLALLLLVQRAIDVELQRVLAPVVSRVEGAFGMLAASEAVRARQLSVIGEQRRRLDVCASDGVVRQRDPRRDDGRKHARRSASENGADGTDTGQKRLFDDHVITAIEQALRTLASQHSVARSADVPVGTEVAVHVFCSSAVGTLWADAVGAGVPGTDSQLERMCQACTLLLVIRLHGDAPDASNGTAWCFGYIGLDPVVRGSCRVDIEAPGGSLGTGVWTLSVEQPTVAPSAVRLHMRDHRGGSIVVSGQRLAGGRLGNEPGSAILSLVQCTAHARGAGRST